MRSFEADLADPGHFVITLELVPKAESGGRSVDTVKNLALAARQDGRLSAVSITDNPGGNPSLSPDALGEEIMAMGMDVIIHFTCRDLNRAGIQSRALQLERMGMNNILALTGDYSGKGFEGQSAPVFDLDSVNLLRLLTRMNQKAEQKNGKASFFCGCAISPFKYSEAECHAQYYKLLRKIRGGARYIVTQLGYDARKYQELMQVRKAFNLEHIPAMASIFLLTPKSARVMNSGRIPGTVVGDRLLQTICAEWDDDKRRGYHAAVERAARLAAIVKGLGYKGIHIGGVHRSFQTVARIMDRMEELAGEWRQFIGEFGPPAGNPYYAFQPVNTDGLSGDRRFHAPLPPQPFCRCHYIMMKTAHNAFFRADALAAPLLRRLAQKIDDADALRRLLKAMERGAKKLLLDCRDCGDCAIQHVGFLCPESGCPKHMRNGACGGSRDGRCEVRPEKTCVWVRAYERLRGDGAENTLTEGIIPPRMWELNETSSWLNFHLGRDHQAGKK
ncbi:MAG: methylenetetrahydrofolate reductase C-terminal domain-containing protein [Thermodesulfobacteriota bacterium]